MWPCGGLDLLPMLRLDVGWVLDVGWLLDVWKSLNSYILSRSSSRHSWVALHVSGWFQHAPIQSDVWSKAKRTQSTQVQTLRDKSNSQKHLNSTQTIYWLGKSDMSSQFKLIWTLPYDHLGLMLIEKIMKHGMEWGIYPVGKQTHLSRCAWLKSLPICHCLREFDSQINAHSKNLQALCNCLGVTKYNQVQVTNSYGFVRKHGTSEFFGQPSCSHQLWLFHRYTVIRRPQPTAGGARQRRDYRQQGSMEACSKNKTQQARDKKEARRSKRQEERCKTGPWCFGVQKATLGTTGRCSVLHCHAVWVWRSRSLRALAAAGESGGKSKKTASFL